MSRWLRKNRNAFDLVYVLNLRYEAYAAVGALRGTESAVCLRCQDSGQGSDGWWQAHARFGARIRRVCQQAVGIVTPNTFVAEELVSYGYLPSRVHEIPLGVVAGEARSADRRFRSRAALSEVNHDLTTAEYAPLAVLVGRLDDYSGLSYLLAEWREIAQRWPSARLWFLGEGSARDRAGRRLVDLDLQDQVFMPGTFEDWSDVFQAADVFLWPVSYGGRQLLLEAMAAGLPVVAADAPDLRGMMEHGKHGLLVPAHSPGAWSAAISRLFDAPQLAAQLGAAAGKLVTARYPRRQMAEAHCDLFERSLHRRRP
jgi:glycosyltransferase involved in cell wall biosynthesis